MRRPLRIAGTWALRGTVVLLLLAALDITALAFPYPFFPHRQDFGEFTVCSSRPIPDGFGQVIEDTRTRAAAMEHAHPGADHRVFLCSDERLYSLFAFLTRRSPSTMAIGLSVFRNMYLNEPKIRRVAAHNVLGIRHSRLEGDLAEVIAHEIAHGTVVRRLGFRNALALPVWKSEGYAEYQANLAAARADDSYVFADRVALLLDDAAWSGSHVARQLFEWHLLVEFLAEEKGVRLEALADQSVTETWARQEMLAWYGGQRSAR